jgi:hypothetical protein
LGQSLVENTERFLFWGVLADENEPSMRLLVKFLIRLVWLIVENGHRRRRAARICRREFRTHRYKCHKRHRLPVMSPYSLGHAVDHQLSQVCQIRWPSEPEPALSIR